MTAKRFVPLSAVTAGVKDVRAVVDEARRLLGEQGRGTILFLDEVHRFNRTQQDALLPSVEEGLIVLIGATTENPFFEVNAPLLSRSTLWRLEPLTHEDLALVVAGALDAEGAAGRRRRGGRPGGPGRRRRPGRAHHPRGGPGPGRPTGPVTAPRTRSPSRRRAPAPPGCTATARTTTTTRSAPSSSPSGARTPTPACTGWPACSRPGEDARFIARRLVILASEDVGEADPLALVVADAAARAVEFVGLPEAQLNLAQAVVHLATAPKSNRVTVALGRARSDARDGPRGEVPAHLRDAHYKGAAVIGHGEGYRYPHDDPRGWIEQGYRPAELEGRVYYEPSDHGHEAVVGDRLRARRRGETPAPDDGEGDR